MTAAADNRATRLDEASILEEARERAGLDDFGSPEFWEPLRVILRGLEDEARLNPGGRMGQRERIVGLLVNRLRAQSWFARHPEIVEETLEDPIVIVGFPRTGTTMLHRTIASEPRMYSIAWWETRNPAPFPGWTPENAALVRDPRIADAEEQIRAMLEANPDLAAVHPFEAEGPDEEIMILEHSFISGVPPAFANLPSYFDWLEAHDNGPGYAYMKQLIQFLQWQKKQRGEERERWVLKTPHHLMHLDLLFEHFPGATVIQTHRDPVETMPSFASMNYESRLLASDEVDAEETGAQWCNRFRKAMERCLDVRDRMPAERFVDIWYRDAVADPIAQVKRIYDHVGMTFTKEAERAMLAWAEENRRGDRPTHDYTLEQFGFSEESLRRDFAGYRARFIAERS